MNKNLENACEKMQRKALIASKRKSSINVFVYTGTNILTKIFLFQHANKYI